MPNKTEWPDEERLGEFPKNNNNRIGLTRKVVRTRSTGEYQVFLDLRNEWDRDGNGETWTPTRKGAMIPRVKTPELAAICLADLKPDELPEETALQIEASMVRLRGPVSRDRIVALLKSLPADVVNAIIQEL